MNRRNFTKTMVLVLCVVSSGLLMSCTKDNSDNGSGNGSNTPLLVGRWKCTYAHMTITHWTDGEQDYFSEEDLNTGGIIEFHLDGTTNDCVYSVQGSNLTMCDQNYHIDKLTATELHYTYEKENTWNDGGSTCVNKQVIESRYSRF